jgi:hypothetical protein
VEVRMLIKKLEKLQSDAMAVRNILQFQEKLNSETVAGKFRILSKLLADECSELNKDCGHYYVA